MNSLINENKSVSNISMSESIKQVKYNFIREVETNPAFQEKVTKHIGIKKGLEEVEYLTDIQEVDIGVELRDFLRQPSNTKTTQNNYRIWINSFLNYCRGENINPVSIKKTDVDGYMVSLMATNSNNSVRSKLMGVCSFYKFMIGRHLECFKSNPFNGLKLPKKQLSDKRKVDKVLDSDIKTLIGEFKRIGREDMVCLVEILSKYGFRVGIFENLEVGEDGSWRGVTKGSDLISGKNGWKKFSKKETEKLRGCGLLGKKQTHLSNIFIKYTKKLFKEKKISCDFSPHDLRHYCITRELNNCRGFEDSYRVSRKYHKQYETTVGYYNS